MFLQGICKIKKKNIFIKIHARHESKILFSYSLVPIEKILWNKIGNKKFTGLLYPEKVIHKVDSVKNAYKNSTINALKSIIERISNALHLKQMI